MMDKQAFELKKILAFTRALENGLRNVGAIDPSNWRSFVTLVERAEALTKENLQWLRDVRPDLEEGYVSASLLRPKMEQLVAYLAVFEENDAVIEIGVLLNSIKDAELRARCLDLLIAKGHFDRVINQATLILEDRIRKKVGGVKQTGVQLVNDYIKASPEESTIIVSDDGDAQSGFASICRGIMQALRNETHHHLVESFSREEAFHICGFIDRLLKLIDEARVRA